MEFRKDLTLRYLRNAEDRLRLALVHLIRQEELIAHYQTLKGFRDEPPKYTEVEISQILYYLGNIEASISTINSFLLDSKIIEHSRTPEE